MISGNAPWTGTQSGRRIAIVAEDDPANRMVLCRMLERLGYEPIRAVNGLQAVDLVEKTGANVVFMDLRMPQLGGHDALALIRSDRTSNRTRVIAVTGDVTEDSKRACARAGFDAFLAKPIDYKTLQSLLAE
jgi:CheY-like chemotaxis protein